jgi:hypothetical protein
VISRIRNAPKEIQLPLLILLGGTVVFLVVGAVRGLLVLPLGLGALEILAIVMVLVRLSSMRVAVILLFGVAGLIHLLIAMGSGPLWIRVISGIIAIAGFYGAVLLSTGPARDFMERK